MGDDDTVELKRGLFFFGRSLKGPLRPSKNFYERLERSLKDELEVVLCGFQNPVDQAPSWDLSLEQATVFAEPNKKRALRNSLRALPAERREFCANGMGILPGTITYPLERRIETVALAQVLGEQATRTTVINNRRKVGLDLFHLLDPDAPLRPDKSDYPFSDINSPLASCFDVQATDAIQRMSQAAGKDPELAWEACRVRVAHKLIYGKKPTIKERTVLKSRGICLSW